MMDAFFMNAAIYVLQLFGIISHRRRPHADAYGMNPAAVQSFDQCRLQRGGTEPPIIAHSDPASACPRDQRAEAPANRIGVLFGECFTDNAANIIFTQGGPEIGRASCRERVCESV